MAETVDRTHAPEVRIAYGLTLPGVETVTLSNGIRLHYMDGGTQDVNQLSLCWQGGLAEAQSPNHARLLAAMLPEGTTTLDGTAISEKLDYCGAMLGLTAESHFTTLTLTVLNSLTSKVLPVISDIISSPSFPEDRFEKVRDKQAYNHALSMSKVMPVANVALAPLVNGASHPLSQPNSVEEIMSVTRPQVFDTWQRTITAAGCSAFLSGRLTSAVVSEVCRMLESLPADAPACPLNVVPYTPQAPCTVVSDMPDAVQAAVLCGLPAPSRSHPDYVPLRFAVMALGGFFSSRLMLNIREDKGYTYGINSSLMGQQDGSYTVIGAQTDARYIDLLLDELRNELRRMATEPLTDDELYRLRQHMSLTFMETLDTPFSIIDHYRAMLTVGIPEGYFAAQQEALRTVDAAKVSEMAEKYLQPDDLRVSIAR